MRTFAKALLDRGSPAPPGSAPDRVAVYRNNVHAGLAEALAASFSVTRALVGEVFFKAMAVQFVECCPPRSPVLATYGEALPVFIEAFPPTRSVPYLPDIARLELASIAACHAADAVALEPENFAAVDPRLPVLVPHPAGRVLRSRYPIASILRAHQAAGACPVPAADPETALVKRPCFEVHVTTLISGQAAFLDAISAGESLARAVSTSLEAEPGLDLLRCLTTTCPALMIQADLSAAPVVS